MDLIPGGVVRPITVMGAPVLASPCAEVTAFDDDLRTLVADMFASMYAAGGVGLAANQVGVGLRVFVIDCPFPRAFDARTKTWGEEITWEDVLVRWKARGPMNEAYRARMPVPRPSRATAVAALMNAQYQVEMTFVAAAGKTIVNRPGAEPQPDATLAQAVTVGRRVFVSGMLGADFKASVEDQTRSVVERLGVMLKASGYEWSHVGDVTLYVTDPAHAEAARKARQRLH